MRRAALALLLLGSAAVLLGVRGCWSGDGSMVTPVTVTCSPWNVTGAPRHSSVSTSSDSSSRAARSRRSPGSPNAVNSSGTDPSPAPRISRPPDSRSKVTDSRATLPTRRRASWFIRTPNRIRLVRAATAPMTTVGSATGQRWSRYSR